MSSVAGHLAYPAGDAPAARALGRALGLESTPFDLGPLQLAEAAHRLGPLAAALDGRLLNARELRDELGGESRTGDDAEVLLRAWERWGEGCLPRLRGPFALAVWDADARRLFLARDAFGEAPLVYAASTGALWFAGSLKALKAAGAPLGQLDRGALSDWLELLCIPAPATIYTGARKLPAGHLLVAGEGGTQVRRWFEPPTPGAVRGRPLNVRGMVEEAVRLRTAPGAVALLSGGPQAAALAHLLARDGKPRTFAAGLAPADPVLEHARAVAQATGAEHQEILLGASIAAEVEAAAHASAEPVGDPEAVTVLAAFRALPRGAVVLTCDGADELFGGRARYRRAEAARLSPRTARAALLASHVAPLPLALRLRRAAAVLGNTGERRDRALAEVFAPEERRALLGGARAATGPLHAPAGNADAGIAFDLEVWLPDGLLRRTRLAAREAQLEARPAFVDVPLARAVVPPVAAHKLGRDAGNLLLSEAFAGAIPEPLLAPTPAPALPLAAWLRGPLRPLLGDLVRTPTARIRTMLNPRALDRLLEASVHGDGLRAFALLQLELWARAR